MPEIGVLLIFGIMLELHGRSFMDWGFGKMVNVGGVVVLLVGDIVGWILSVR